MNPAFSHIVPSLIRAVNGRKRPGDIDLGMGEPVLPIDMAPLEASLAWARKYGCPYSPNPGYMELREQIVQHYRYPYHAHAQQVCVTVGSEEALYLALRLAIDPGSEELLIVEPAYPAYDKICLIEKIPHRIVSLDPATGFAPSAQVVLEALRPETRAILLCSPCNPTGRSWPKVELELLARALLERPGPPVQVLWDEVYREIYFSDAPPTSMAELYPHTWVMNSLSKSHALTGMRIGWLMAPAGCLEGALPLHHLSVTSAPTLSQRVAIELFNKPESFRAHRREYLIRQQVMEATLEEVELHALPMEGSFYAFLKIEGVGAQDSVRAAFGLIDQAHVVTVPGRAFGACAEGWLRVSYVAQPSFLWEGLRRIKRGMEQLKLEQIQLDDLAGDR